MKKISLKFVSGFIPHQFKGIKLIVDKFSLFRGNRLKTSAGFTLIELLVVIAIIGTISTLASLSINRTRIKSRDAKRIADIKTLLEATELYIQNNEDRLPPSIPIDLDWQKLFGSNLRQFIKSDQIPVDPSFKDGGVYVYCYSGHNYMFGTLLESKQTMTQDLDQINYSAADCLFSNGKLPKATVGCSDDGSADWDGWRVLGPAYCQGLDKNS